MSEDLSTTHISHEKKTLFWMPVGLQDRTVWALIDTGATRNLISQRDYEALPQRPTLRPPGEMKIVAETTRKFLYWVGPRYAL